MMLRLEHSPFDPALELGEFTARAEGAGAIVSFIGLARSFARSGTTVDALVLESYRSVTLRSLQEIVTAAHARFEITRSQLVHREGRLAPHEPIVFVATASSHRRAAFEAADYIMDRLKSEAVFWKREEGSAGVLWIEPSFADAVDLARWNNY